MYGVSWDDPECLHTVDEAIEYINRVGFLPLFKNEIPGFSLEERTVPEYWWSDDPEVDPWKWREIIARSGRVAYGKFFNRKAGFISEEWLPCFVNYRRDGYDFDALWEDGKASARQKKIMDLFAEEFEDVEYFSNELKQRSISQMSLNRKPDSARTATRGSRGLLPDCKCRPTCVFMISDSEGTGRVWSMAGRLRYTARRSICGDMIL